MNNILKYTLRDTILRKEPQLLRLLYDDGAKKKKTIRLALVEKRF